MSFRRKLEERLLQRSTVDADGKLCITKSEVTEVLLDLTNGKGDVSVRGFVSRVLQEAEAVHADTHSEWWFAAHDVADLFPPLPIPEVSAAPSTRTDEMGATEFPHVAAVLSRSAHGWVLPRDLATALTTPPEWATNFQPPVSLPPPATSPTVGILLKTKAEKTRKKRKGPKPDVSISPASCPMSLSSSDIFDVLSLSSVLSPTSPGATPQSPFAASLFNQPYDTISVILASRLYPITGLPQGVV
eukprot:Sspe_Gene.49889::Locus_27282_Transcript_1_1_Confidence_1.000_Length_4678::g.49889::m.49889